MLGALTQILLVHSTMSLSSFSSHKPKSNTVATFFLKIAKTYEKVVF